MTDPVRVSFPALNTNYTGVPRRYEETRPVNIQNFTHQRIVGIGRDIQRRVLNSIEAEKLESLRKAENSVWEEAKKEIKKADLLARQEEKAIAEKTLVKQAKEYEQQIKEECLKVEVAMQKQAVKQVQEERAKGEEALAEAVARTEKRCHEELLAAVDTARAEERKKAADNERMLIKKHTTEVENLKKAAAEDKSQALEQLKAIKEKERVRAVKEVQEYTQKVADKRLQEVREDHKVELAKLLDVIADWQQEVKNRELIIAQKEQAKANVGEKLLEVRQHFQEFINRVKLFEEGQSDYLLPPMYLEEIERKGILSRPL